MKRKSIYKQIALSLLLLAGTVGSAWGQERRDMYVDYSAGLEVNRDGRSGNGASTDPSAMFDGNDDTWWGAAKDDENKGALTITLSFRKAQTFTGLSVYCSGNPDERAKKIEINTWNSTTKEWETKHTESEIETSGDRELSITLEESITAKDVQLIFTPEDGQWMAINEITFTNSNVSIGPVANLIGKALSVDAKVQHKPAKWFTNPTEDNPQYYDVQNQWFSDGQFDESEKLQATHMMVDTIYMHPGHSVTLSLPDRLNNSLSSCSYQRWFSLRTGKNFATTREEGAKVKDLLTPTESGTFYRFQNGYVGRPMYLSSEDGKLASMNFYMPTEDEYNEWFDTGISYPDWFIVACDVSHYKDFGNDGKFQGEDGGYHEPTLSHRVVFFIQNVKAGEDSHKQWYKEAWNGTGPLEKYEINMPFTRYPDTKTKNSNTSELYEVIALSKDARAYANPDKNEDPEDIVLTVEVDDTRNTAGLTEDCLKTKTLKGANRIILFDYPVKNDDNTKSVNGENNSYSVILVKDEDGRTLVEFTLRFTKGTSLMTQSMIQQLNKNGEDLNGTSWGAYKERTPQYMEKNYTYLTGLDFDDYDDTPNTFKDGAVQIHPRPLPWDDCSYAFYDGSSDENEVEFPSGTQNAPQWGYYSILNGYMEKDRTDDWGWTAPSQSGEDKMSTTCMERHKENPDNEDEKSKYHLYVDASDRPGVIARLPFTADLCAGSELFVSAWVKSAKYNKEVDNAAMLFTIMGVTGEGEYVPLYRHQTGQIPSTHMNGSSINLPGFGPQNEWFQLAFSFVTDEDIKEKYVDKGKGFVLQIENNSASTSGGDMYLDDVRVYLRNVTAEVTQQEATCSDVRTRLNFSIDWDQLISRTGEKNYTDGDFPTTTDDIAFSGIGLCFIDQEKLDSEEDFDDCVVWVGADDGDGTVNNYQYAAMFYKLEYDRNTEYSDGQANYTDGALAKNNNWFFYTDGESDGRKLTVDFFADIKPYKKYTMMVIPLEADLLKEAALESGDMDEAIEYIREKLKGEDYKDRFQAINDDCAIKTDVWVTSQSLITADGEIIRPDEEYCVGQILNFAVQLRAPTGTSGQLEPVKETVYFDWFFGTEQEFTEPTGQDGTVSLETALKGLRTVDQGVKTEEGVEDIQPDERFTQEMKDLILEKMRMHEEGQNARLVLHKENLNIQLLEDGLNVVVSPIEIEIAGITDDIKVCWEYVPLELKADGKSPVAQIGFHDVTYFEEPNIRIGLAQIKGATEETSALKINLRNVEVIEENGVLKLNNSKTQLFLVGSNDPDVEALTGKPDFEAESLPVGTLHEIVATKKGNNDGSNYIRISFDLEGTQTKAENNPFTFKPKEGYEYRLKVYFQEEVNGRQVTSLCDGSLTFTMKVVPEYQFWLGTATDNWNDDSKWVRANAEDMNNPIGYSDYTDPHVHQGYVPMRFTKVVIPTEKPQVELYGYTTSGRSVNINDKKPETIGGSTQYIEYDLMVKSATGNNYAYDCEPYYSNTVNQIHFEPKAEMLHAELLTYEKAWVDYELEEGEWHTLASPLQAVVSGDWYTETSGRQETEYFKDITFTEDYDRLVPAVYQRGWGRNATMVETTTGDNNPSVAVSGNWSGVYNDVEEKFTPGSGFSVKVVDDNATENALFRFPKSDVSFDYVTATKAAPEPLERDSLGRLQSNILAEEELFTVTLQPAKGELSYYLVGNPFMTALNMEKFFEENNSLKKKYWHIMDGKQDIASAADNTWTSTENGLTIPPLQSFFVQKAGTTATADEELTVTFTAKMQTLSTKTDGTTNSNALILTAKTADGKMSRAAVAYDGAAKATYEADEDAELFLDSNLSDVPAIYTVAGTMATSINRTSELYNIPVGIYGNSTEMVTLSFEGLNHFSSATLYDAEEKTETPLREGTTLTVPANTSGRYFLRAGTPTANEIIETSDIQIYTLSGNRVMVTSNMPLKDIRVYTMNGAQVKHTKAGICSFELYLPDGIYLITAQNTSGETQTEKIVVR